MPAVWIQPENGVSCRGCNAGREAAEAGLSILKEFLNRRFRVQQIDFVGQRGNLSVFPEFEPQEWRFLLKIRKMSICWTS